MICVATSKLPHTLLVIGYVNDVLAKAADLVVIGGLAKRRRLVVIVYGRQGLVELHVFLAEEAVVGLHLGVDGVADGLLLCRLVRLGELKLHEHILHAEFGQLRRRCLLLLVRRLLFRLLLFPSAPTSS